MSGRAEVRRLVTNDTFPDRKCVVWSQTAHPTTGGAA